MFGGGLDFCEGLSCFGGTGGVQDGQAHLHRIGLRVDNLDLRLRVAFEQHLSGKRGGGEGATHFGRQEDRDDRFIGLHVTFENRDKFLHRRLRSGRELFAGGHFLIEDMVVDLNFSKGFITQMHI